MRHGLIRFHGYALKYQMGHGLFSSARASANQRNAKTTRPESEVYSPSLCSERVGRVGELDEALAAPKKAKELEQKNITHTHTHTYNAVIVVQGS